tara:strand:+ start:3366 stop:3524 length:159 start_codon:yes stop_codon:yes gene_type:complete
MTVVADGVDWIYSLWFYSVIEDSFVKKFSDEELYKYGTFDNEMVYFCQKNSG